MAAKSFGTAHLYGVAGTISNASVQAYNKRSGFQLQDAVKDENGLDIEHRYDDRISEATISLLIQSGYSIPAQGDTLVYDSIDWEITEVNAGQVNQGFRTVDLTLKNTESVDPIP